MADEFDAPGNDQASEAAPESMDDFMSSAFDGMTEALETATGDETTAAPPNERDNAATQDSGDKPEESADESGKPSQEAIAPPSSMSAKDREAFYKLPPDQQKWLSERVKQQEGDYTRKTMQLAEQKKSLDRLEQIIAPRRQQLAMQGMDESTAVGQLFALSDFANSDPVGFVRYLLTQRGIPVSALTDNPGNQPDPQLIATQRELNGIKNLIHQQQTQQQQQTVSAVSSVIADFAKENPFYGELEAEMIPLVQALRQSNPGLSHKDALTKAYKAALANNEAVSAKIEVDRKAKEDAERIAKAKAEAAEAKRAQGTTIRKSGGGLPKAKTVDEFIGALYDERAA